MHAYVAAILVKLSLASSMQAKGLAVSNLVACVNIKQFRFISAYFRPSIYKISSFFSSDLCDKLTPHVIFSVDSNVKNLLWNSRTTDAKGVKLEELNLDNNLSIVNTSLSELNFVPKKTSFLDLTLMRDKVSIARWFYPDIPSFSDHPYIYFEVVPSTKDMWRSGPPPFSARFLKKYCTEWIPFRPNKCILFGPIYMFLMNRPNKIDKWSLNRYNYFRIIWYERGRTNGDILQRRDLIL